jgi:hypothetical protein
LTVKPRFFYSLFFIILPWFFYFFEFFHSRHRDEITRKVSITTICAYYFNGLRYNVLVVCYLKQYYLLFIQLDSRCKSKCWT